MRRAFVLAVSLVACAEDPPARVPVVYGALYPPPIVTPAASSLSRPTPAPAASRDENAAPPPPRETAAFLTAMHQRIHPLFAVQFLGDLSALPEGHPLRNPSLETHLEIVLDATGHLEKMGVIRSSGVTAFDIAALDAVDRAQPFPPPPAETRSRDDRTYVHWEFHARPEISCSTINARTFLLR